MAFLRGEVSQPLSSGYSLIDDRDHLNRSVVTTGVIGFSELFMIARGYASNWEAYIVFL